MLLQAFFNVFILIVASRFAETPGHPIWLWEAAIGLTVLVFWLIVYRLVVTRLLAATVVTILVACITAGLAVGVAALLPRFGVGMYAVTSNNMTPTLRGLHYEGKHPETGETMWVPRHDFADFVPAESFAISPTTRAIVWLNEWDKTPRNGDRILVNHFLPPRRFDLAVYHPPPPPDPLIKFNPESKFVGRLFGLPGEEIEIRAGDVWIDGVKLELPAEMTGHKIHGGDFGRPPELYESPPRKLAENEYFILGDFSVYSADSRTFGPVPEANLLGSVTAVYWPPSRWRVLR